MRTGEVAGDLLDSFGAGIAAGLERTAGGWAVQALVEGGFLTGSDASDGSMVYNGFMASG